MCVDICVDVCVDMCADVCVDVCVGTWSNLGMPHLAGNRARFRLILSISFEKKNAFSEPLEC